MEKLQDSLAEKTFVSNAKKSGGEKWLLVGHSEPLTKTTDYCSLGQ